MLDDVFAVLSHAADADERRVAARRRFDRPVPVTLVNRATGIEIAGELVDLSASGIGVRLKCPLEPGKEFALVLPSQPRMNTPLRYRVSRCAPLADRAFHIGAAFVRTGRHVRGEEVIP